MLYAQLPLYLAGKSPTFQIFPRVPISARSPAYPLLPSSLLDQSEGASAETQLHSVQKDYPTIHLAHIAQ